MFCNDCWLDAQNNGVKLIFSLRYPSRDQPNNSVAADLLVSAYGVAKLVCRRSSAPLGGRNLKISELGADSEFGITA